MIDTNSSRVDSSVYGSPPQSPTEAAANKPTNPTLKYAQVWEVVSQIPLKKGGYLSAKFSPVTRHRLLSVEVHRILPYFEGDEKAGSNEGSDVTQSKKFIQEAEACYVRILKPEHLLKHIDLPRIGDDYSHSHASPITNWCIDTEVDDIEDFDRIFDGWVATYRLPVSMVEFVGHKKRTVEMKGESKGHVHEREYVFKSEAEATEFIAAINNNKNLQEQRARARLQYRLSGITLQKNEQLSFLIDICSAMDLPKTDVARDCDPYVTVRFNGRKIHKTHYISNEDNPIWTLKSKSLFIWNIDALELFKSEEGLVFEVKDYDAVGANESMGAFGIPPRTLYGWKDGERKTFSLKPLLGKHDYGQGRVAIRVRRATQHDIEFMDNMARGRKNKPEKYFFSDIKGGAGTLKSLTTTYKKKEKEGPDKNKMKYLVRPGPDPKRKDETKWLTKERIEEETMTDSWSWIDVGSGHLGKVFVEVLKCDNLPNMDTMSKTDTFVALVYEDCYAMTDVINDCLSPRWMFWSQRAFIFNMMHTSSQLFLGVFDYDASSPVDNHDFIGRVSVDLSNFQPDTVYVLKYKLYPSARAKYSREQFDQKFEKDPSKHSTITIRLRMEVESERTLLLSNFNYPSTVYVNVDNKKDFHVIHDTIIGDQDLRQYGLGNLNAYVEELLDLLTVYYFLEDGFISLILWKSSSIITVPMIDFRTFTLGWVNFGLPLHSLMAFICATSLLENLQLLPSFSLGSIAWLLFVTMELRSHSPNPWKRSKPLSKMIYSLIVGKNGMESQSIKANENLKAIEEHENRWKTRLKDAEKKAAQKALEYAKQQEEYLEQMDAVGGNTDITTKMGWGFSIDPTKRWLLPIHEWLGIICETVRVIKNIIVWEECYITFWVALGSFLLSIIFYFIPWAFLTKWTLRIIVWVFFGPWMKLLDVFYFSKFENESDEEKLDRMKQLKAERDKWLETQKLDLHLKNERARKLKDFKEQMFGKCIAHVNLLKRDRFYDIPLPASYAFPHIQKRSSLGSLAIQEAGYLRRRLNGQQLVGDMIPELMDDKFQKLTEAPIGKPAKKTEHLKKDSPGAMYSKSDDYFSAALRVAFIVIGAGFITWFGVPLSLHVVKLISSPDMNISQ